jgi:hypothetical protein
VDVEWHAVAGAERMFAVGKNFNVAKVVAE